jgi:hypothetical protein
VVRQIPACCAPDRCLSLHAARHDSPRRYIAVLG